MSQPLIAVTDHVFPDLEPTEQALASLDADVRLAPDKSPESILSVARQADGVIVCYASLSADVIDGLERCRIIARTGIGVDNVDIEAASAKGIVVTNVPEYCEDEVSDHAMALLLALARKVTTASLHAHAGQWDLEAVKPIHRLRGRTVGLVGFGKIPRLVSAKAQAFGLHVVAFDPFVAPEDCAALGVDSVSFEELLGRSDYVSVHAPLTPDTDKMINADALAQMRPGSVVINTARGPLVDVDALADALDAGHIAGAGLDVLPEEPPPADSRLIGRENVILTPHTGFYSEESMIDLQAKAAQQVALVLSGSEAVYAVNRDKIG